jgi:hypothetical protein
MDDGFFSSLGFLSVGLMNWPRIHRPLNFACRLLFASAASPPRLFSVEKLRTLAFGSYPFLRALVVLVG